MSVADGAWTHVLPRLQRILDLTAPGGVATTDDTELELIPLIEVGRRSRSDAYPESPSVNWDDTGCEVSESCLRCPLFPTDCLDAMPNGHVRFRLELVHLAVVADHDAGFSVEEIMLRRHVSNRTVFRRSHEQTAPIVIPATLLAERLEVFDMTAEIDQLAASIAAERARVQAELERLAAEEAALALITPRLEALFSVPMTPGAAPRGNGGRFVKVEPAG